MKSNTTKNRFALPAPVAASRECTDEVVMLIVDDEPLVRNLLEVYLNAQGIRTLVAEDGRQAVELYAAHAEEIDLVLLDVQMPAMSGPSTLAEIQRINPDVVSCFMSGNPGEYTTSDLLGMGAKRFFSKPLTLADLSNSLKEIVASHRA